MRSEVVELKKNSGEIRLVADSLDDLWHLHHLIAPGDLVFATTFRSTESATDKLRPEKTEKKPVRLGIRVERSEFSIHANRLRISGLIESGVDAGSYHTIGLETGREVSIIKHWRGIELERIDRAVAASEHNVVHILAIEEGEAELYRIRQFGPEKVDEAGMGSGKREDSGGRAAFFERCMSMLSGVTGPVVVAGPGFVKEEFAAFVARTDSELFSRLLPAETRRTGRGAVSEVIGQGILERIHGEIQLAGEVRVMDEVLKRISVEGAVAYGIDQVADAVGYGAVEMIVITDAALRDERMRRTADLAEEMNAKIVVCSTEFEPGQRLDALGGIAALLRYKI